MTRSTIGKCSIVFVLGVCGVTSLVVWAQEGLPGGQPPTQNGLAEVDSSKYSYAIGLEIGGSFQADGVPIDLESIVQGLRDGLAQAEPKYDEQELIQAMQQFTQVRLQAVARQNQKFLEENKQAEGVEVLPSGLQVRVIASGDGATPAATDTVRTHYRGRLIDGTEFDSSYSRNEPAEFGVDEVIPGWTEALQKMKVGDKWELVIPSNLAYGQQGAGGIIPPNATLVFEIELLEIVK